MAPRRPAVAFGARCSTGRGVSDGRSAMDGQSSQLRPRPPERELQERRRPGARAAAARQLKPAHRSQAPSATVGELRRQRQTMADEKDQRRRQCQRQRQEEQRRVHREREDAIDFVCLVSGADPAAARAVLELCAWDVRRSAARALTGHRAAGRAPPVGPRAASRAREIGQDCRSPPPDSEDTTKPAEPPRKRFAVPRELDCPASPAAPTQATTSPRAGSPASPRAGSPTSAAGFVTSFWQIPSKEDCEALFHQFKHKPDHDRAAAAIEEPAQFAQEADRRAEPVDRADIGTTPGIERPKWRVSPRVSATTPRSLAWGENFVAATERASKATAASHAVEANRLIHQKHDPTAGSGLRLDELEDLASYLWAERALPSGAMALAHAVQDLTADGWVRSAATLRLTLRFAVYFARHWGSFTETNNSCTAADAHGIRSLAKDDFVQGYVALMVRSRQVVSPERQGPSTSRANSPIADSSETSAQCDVAAAAATDPKLVAEAAAEAAAGFDAIAPRGTARTPAAVPFVSYCRWVASRRVADAFVLSDTGRAACYPPFISLHRPVLSAREALAQFLEQLGPAPKPKAALKPWEHAIANRHGHSTMLDAASKWAQRLENRAERAAQARERLYAWAVELLEEEAQSMTPESIRRRQQQRLAASRPNQGLEGAATAAVMSELFDRKASARTILDKMASTDDETGERILTPTGFVAALRQVGISLQIATDETLLRVFDEFDINEDGTVTPGEFMAALRQAEAVAAADAKAKQLEREAEALAAKQACEHAHAQRLRQQRAKEMEELAERRRKNEAEGEARAAAVAQERALHETRRRAQQQRARSPTRNRAGAPAANGAVASSGDKAPVTVRGLLNGTCV